MGTIIKTLLIWYILICCGCTRTIVLKPAPPPIVERPILAVTKINNESTNDQVVKYYRITIEQLMSYSKQLELIVNEYRNQSK